MKSNLTDLIDAISIIDGRVTISDLSPTEVEALRDKIIWGYSDLRSPKAIFRFGGKDFRQQGASKSLTISTGSPQYDYELKAILILLLHVGVKEGGTPYKWRSTTPRIRTLAKFSHYCTQRGLNSFREIEPMPALKLRNLILGFITDSNEAGGMDGLVKTSSYKTVRSGLKHLVSYGLVVRSDFMQLLDEFTLANIDKHVAENRLRHSIIPTSVMKRVIAEAITYVERAENRFEEFSHVFRQTHRAIVMSKHRNTKSAIYSAERKAAKTLKVILYDNFRDLHRHTYALILSFTGMRDDESSKLQTGCEGHRSEKGEDLYYLRSWLSKTDDSEISLDWVANELAYRAVQLLSKVNELYYERARLSLKHYGMTMSEAKRVKMEHGLRKKLLFGVRLTVASSMFMWFTKGGDSGGALKLNRYIIPVTEADLSQLEQMECNYRSVSANSGNRGKPYAVGDLFNLTAHQFRHTFAWFIIANRLGDLDDIKYQFKHLHRAMTMVYAERGFKSLNELKIVIEHFETFVNGRSIDDIVHSASAGYIAGGGGERLAKMLQTLNSDSEEKIYSDEQQPHFNNIKEVITFTTRHSESIRGLPHGYCTKGPTCKIKNAADPSHCLYCDTYFATPKHLPYWRAIFNNCKAKIERIAGMPEEVQQQFISYRQAIEDNLFAAKKIIDRLSPNGRFSAGAD